MCDHQVYTFLFWNSRVGEADQKLFDTSDKVHVYNNLQHVLNNENLQKLADEQKLVVPFVTGQFTNWEPRPMMNMKDFIDRFDAGKPSLRNLAIKKSLIDEKYNGQLEDALTEMQINMLTHELNEQLEKYQDLWMPIMQRNMRYTRPVLINADKKTLLDDKRIDLFIYAGMMRCGR